ncbi:MAG: histidine phosphatase family protein [Acidimicrobiales bacterium]
MATRILLLRHAQSAWNATGRWQGWADPPLSVDGAAEAAAAAADPVLDQISAAVASDLDRARATASIMAAHRGWPDVRTFRGLRERGAGEWTGLTRDEIEQRWPGALAGAVLDIPGGEAVTAVTSRAIATLHRVAAEWPDAAILAVCHGALIRLVEQYGGRPSRAIPNLAGGWVEVRDGAISIGPPVALAPVGSSA